MQIIALRTLRLFWEEHSQAEMPLRTWYAIPLGVFCHAVAYAAARRDPQFWDVFRRAILYKVFYRV